VTNIVNDGKSGGQPANRGLQGKWLLKCCVDHWRIALWFCCLCGFLCALCLIIAMIYQWTAMELKFMSSPLVFCHELLLSITWCFQSV